MFIQTYVLNVYKYINISLGGVPSFRTNSAPSELLVVGVDVFNSFRPRELCVGIFWARSQGRVSPVSLSELDFLKYLKIKV